MVTDLELMLFLASKAGWHKEIKLSTGKIALQLKTSQQTISRRLRELEGKGLLERKVLPYGVGLQITSQGKKELQGYHLKLKNLFEGRQPTSFTGMVCKGIGEGAYYVSKYNALFKKHLGFTAFPGTLNLKVDRAEALSFLDRLEKVEINSFSSRDRTFGKTICYLVKVNSCQAAIVLPERTRHEENILELIAPAHLRSKLSLKDNSVLEVYR